MAARDHQAKITVCPKGTTLWAGSSQSEVRVQPAKSLMLLCCPLLFVFVGITACKTDPFDNLQGTWVLDLDKMQSHLRKAERARAQAEVAAHLAEALLERYRFVFEDNILRFGQDKSMRSLTLKFKKYELGKRRQVFTVEGSLYRLRLESKADGMSMDFEENVWHLRRINE